MEIHYIILLSCMVNFLHNKKGYKTPLSLSNPIASHWMASPYIWLLKTKSSVWSWMTLTSSYFHLWSISIYTLQHFLSIYYVPGTNIPHGPRCLGGKRANAQDQKSEVIDPISFFSICHLPSPLPLWLHHRLPSSHTPAAAMLASILPGTYWVRSPRGRAVL